MKTVYFSRSKLITQSLLMAVGLPIMGLIAVSVMKPGLITAIGAFLIFVGPIGALGTIKNLFGDLVAIRYDQRDLSFTTIWKRHQIEWSKVKSVNASVMTTRMLGVIPVGKDYDIDVRFDRPLLGEKSVSLSFNLFDENKEELLKLVAEMESVRRGAPVPAAEGSPRINMSSPASPSAAQFAFQARDPLEGAPRDQAFDADAAFARYMAKRAQEEAQQMPAAPPAAYPQRQAGGFGRKGL